MAYKSILPDDVIVCAKADNGQYHAVLLSGDRPLWSLAGFNSLDTCENFKASCYRVGEIDINYWIESELFDIA